MPKRATPKPPTLDVAATLDRLIEDVKRGADRHDVLEARVKAIEDQFVTQAVQNSQPGPNTPIGIDERLTALETATGVNPPATDSTDPAHTILARLDRLEARHP